jgi:chromosome condensin MukBEF ATPase and DNA-binding subunit MukB
MSELTLENLARRLEEVERRLNEKQPSVIAPTKNWRSVVGISEDTDFSRLMQAEMNALRDADRRAAETEDCE